MLSGCTNMFIHGERCSYLAMELEWLIEHSWRHTARNASEEITKSHLSIQISHTFYEKICSISCFSSSNSSKSHLKHDKIFKCWFLSFRFVVNCVFQSLSSGSLRTWSWSKERTNTEMVWKVEVNLPSLPTNCLLPIAIQSIVFFNEFSC